MAQFQLTVLQFLLRPLPVSDVSARSEPLYDPAVAIADRRSAGLKPTIDTVAPANTVFHVVRLSSLHRVRPELPRRLTIIRVQGVHPTPAEQVALPDSGIVCPLCAEIVARAVRTGAPYH